MKTLFTIFVTITTAGIVGILGFFWFIYSGVYDVSASTPDSPALVWIMHTTSDNAVGARLAANKPPLGLDTEAMVEMGGHLYGENCVVCHGGPGLVASNIAKGINPSPPDLFRASREPSAPENFQFIKHGVKMTGMPAFVKNLSDPQIWSLVAFLNKGPGMTADYFITHTGYTEGAVH